MVYSILITCASMHDHTGFTRRVTYKFQKIPHSVIITHARTHVRTHTRTHARTHAYTPAYIYIYILYDICAINHDASTCFWMEANSIILLIHKLYMGGGPYMLLQFVVYQIHATMGFYSVTAPEIIRCS